MTSSAKSSVRYVVQSDVAVVTADDGKVNALDHKMLDDLQACLARAESEASAVVMAGRPGTFCAGFDLRVMGASRESAMGLLGHGAELFFQSYMLDIPVVAACTGHALAAGAVLLMATDVRIGENAPAKIGLNEVAIGMAVPRFIVEMARDRLSKRHFPWLVLAKVYDSAGAVDAGFLDEVAPEGTSVARAIAIANELTATLDRPAFKATRRRMRGESLDRFRSALDDDLGASTVV